MDYLCRGAECIRLYSEYVDAVDYIKNELISEDFHMELIQGIETRRSIRGFKSDPVPDDIVEKILHTAIKSPSYMNTQPWEVDVIVGVKKDALSRILHAKASSDVPQNPDIPVPEAWPANLEKRFRDHAARRLESLGVDRTDDVQRRQQRMENFRFYGAPCVLIVSIDSTLSGWSIFEAGLFTQSLI